MSEIDSISLSEHDSEKENLPPPSPSSSRKQSKQVTKTKAKAKTRRRKRVFTRKKRVGPRKPLADITHIAIIESSSDLVLETSVAPAPEPRTDLGPSSASIRETGAEPARTGGDSGPPPPPIAGPAGSLRSRKRKAVDENDSSPNTKSLRMGFR